MGSGAVGGRAGLTGRLAPSPTGGLHVGHARTFLIAWASIRSRGGRVILRIEDIDGSRVREDAISGQIRDLEWLGLDWDEGPIRQSERMEVYREALGRLIEAEAVYPCVCTRSDIARAASAPHAGEEGPRYPGTCRFRSAEDARALARAGRSFAWRARAEDFEGAWDDLIRGPSRVAIRDSGGDFVAGRSSGEPSYQLAVSVDDAAGGVTEVIRGDDLVPSTARQLWCLDRLGPGGPVPRYGHVPLTTGPGGARLAKRDGTWKLSTLREGGMRAERLIGELARSCGWGASEKNGELAARDVLECFRLETIPRGVWEVNPGNFGGMGG